MPIAPFQLERYFADYEFKVRYLLSSSDCESLSMEELLQMAAPASLELWKTLKLGYTESQGNPLLRQEAARLYEAVPAENILIAAPEELILIAMESMLSAGDHVIAISPAYQSLHEIARSMGCRVTPWELKPGDGEWKLDLGELEEAITDQTRMLVINFPHNPTGHLLARSTLDQIIDLARKKNITIFSDEMYRLLEIDPAKRLTPVCDLYEKGISLSGLSKAFSLPGLRIGWLATQESGLMEKWIAYHDYTTICNSAPSEVLGMIALQNREQIVERNREIIRVNIEQMERLVKDFPEKFSWYAPQAGSVAFPEWKGEGSVEEFCRGVLDEEGVMVVPGSMFGFPGNHFRVGLGRKNFPEALEHIAAYLERP